MSQAWRALGGKRRTIARQVYAAARATPGGYVCPRCGQPIDWTLPYKDPDTQVVNVWCKSVDHAHETQDGGALTDLANLEAVHLRCNSSKGATRRHERTREARQARQGLAMIAIDPTTL